MANKKKIVQMGFVTLIACLAMCLCCIIGFNSSVVETKAEGNEAVVYDMFEDDFSNELLQGINNWCPEKGEYIIGDYGASDNVGLKMRVYIANETFRFAFTLSSDGVTGTERLPHIIGGYYMVIFTPGSVVVTMPGYYEAYVSAAASYDKLAVGNTVSIEMIINELPADGPPVFTLRMDGETFIDHPADCGNGIYGGVIGSKVLVNSDGNVAFESTSKTCMHEEGEWGQPNENNEIILSCKHCGMLLSKKYYSKLISINELAGQSSLILVDKGVLGELNESEYIGLHARVYLPDTGRFALKFTLFSNGKTFNGVGSYKGAFELVIKNGSFSVLNSNGAIIETISATELSPGRTVTFEFGVYAFNENEHKYFVKFDNILYTSFSSMDDTDTLGLKCAYSVNMPVRVEDVSATCVHIVNADEVVEEDGYNVFSCAECQQVLYRDIPQREFDVSEFTGKDAAVINGKLSMDVQQVGYTAVKGIIYIPSNAPDNFSIKFILMTDGVTATWTQIGELEGMYEYIITKTQVVDTMPWASKIYADQTVRLTEFNQGKTFSFEVGLYQVDDNFDMRQTYLKINGETVITWQTKHDNPFVGTKYLLETNTDIVFMKDSECTEKMHEFGEWSEVNEKFIRTRTCEYCGMVGQQEELPSSVNFKANFVGIINTVSQEVIGEQFVYNVPNVPGYRLKDIQVNGISVFENATEVTYGYEVVIVRNALDLLVEGIYEESSYNIGYQYNKDASITISDSVVGHGNTAVYTILPKNNKDVVKAMVNGVDYTEKLTVIKGGYILEILNVKDNLSLVLEMGKVKYSVSVENTVGGTLDASQSEVDAFGAVQVTATTQEGYYLLYFLVNGEKISSKNGVATIENITENLVVSAVYTMVEVSNSEDRPSHNDSQTSDSDAGCGSVLCTAYMPIILCLCGLAIFTRKRRCENERENA